MKKSGNYLDHPTFGECEVIPSIYAVKLKATASSSEASDFISGLSLKLSAESSSKKEKDSKIEIDPVAMQVNQSETLLWVTDSKSKLDKAAKNDLVEWISPVYRAKAAEDTVQSYFAVNPKTLLINNKAASIVSKLGAMEIEATIDQQRSNLLKGYIVLNLTHPDSLEAASRLSELEELKNSPDAIKLENIPYIIPTISCGY